MCAHLTSKSSQPYFTHVIIESGLCTNPSLFAPLDVSVALGDAFAVHAGCKDKEPAAQLACMRSLNTSEVLNYLLMFPKNFPEGPTAPPHPRLMPLITFVPVIDGSSV